jgi:hypothetical protein
MVVMVMQREKERELCIYIDDDNNESDEKQHTRNH